jgi:UDP-N-acetylglucosamine 2-epimerase (non-hydrolysing)
VQPAEPTTHAGTVDCAPAAHTLRPTDADGYSIVKLLYVVGARPNFVKTAPVVAAMRRRLPNASHVLIHTGQHYDVEMSELFMQQLGMPEPDYRLDVGSGTHAVQTARVMEALERVVLELCPDLAFVPGDVNSTLAAALVFAKLGTPYAHIESGLRSFDRAMPEEINRIVADEFAELLFTHSEEAVANLEAEGINSARVHLVGNTMIDSLVSFEDRFRSLEIYRKFELERGEYLLVTLHRPALVDGPALGIVLAHLDTVAVDVPVLFPVHPRTRVKLDEGRYPRVRFTRPLGYLEFLSAEADARAVLTDSGGVQEETTYLGIPCFTLRSTTERPVTIRSGTNLLLGFDPDRVRDIPELLAATPSHHERPALWDGKASERIVEVVAGAFS